MVHIEGLDEFDNRIIEILKDNARLSYSEIGEQIGISRVSVRKRMEALEEKGIIQGYKAIIDPTQVPGGVQFILDVDTTPEYYEEVIEWLSGSKFINQIYSVSGECAIHATGRVSNPRNLELLSNSLYRAAKKEVRRICGKIVLSTLMDRDGGVDYVRYQESEHLETGGCFKEK